MSGKQSNQDKSLSKRILSILNKMSAFQMVIACILLVSAVLFIFGRTMNLVRVVGDSMEPTYHYGQILTSKKDTSHIQLGDVVMAEVILDEMPTRVIKRVAGMPGDTVQVIDGILYRNGEAVSDAFDSMEDPGLAAAPIHLTEDEYFLLGDNRNQSDDSRVFGAVHADQLERVVTGRFLPFLF